MKHLTINERKERLARKSAKVQDSGRELQDFFIFFNKVYQANLGKLTMGSSPASVGSAYTSWLLQLAQSPGHLLYLAFYPFIKQNSCSGHTEEDEDVRFRHASWQNMPWRWYADNFLQIEDWWCHATQNVPGLSSRVERGVSFGVRQMLDAFSPSNFVWTNPDLFYTTLQSSGLNLIRGTEIAINDTLTRMAGLPPPGYEHFVPGINVAVTPGKVVYSNHLMELIQYSPQTKTVYKEPILMISAWIMKYYILDLSPHNSLVNWLVQQGHTVFIISWRNPTEEDRNLGMDDYYRLGAMAAIDAITKRIPKTPIHLMGYCLGGTLAMIVAAAMANKRDKRLKSLSLLAAQGDFTEAGELMLFINESEVSFLENVMWEKGYLDTKQMAGAFQMLRTNDLIWSKMLDDYMVGKERGMIDLLAWNADATRMPYKMHAEYLEKLFLKNEFAAGHFRIEDELVAPQDIQLPIFAVSTEKDHVAPWKSVYKIHLMVDSDISFVLTNGGHNAGIVNEPDHKGRYYHIHTHQKDTPYIGSVKWLKVAKKEEGSWWPAWHDWLVKNSTKKRQPPPKMKASLPKAPGAYVLQK
jgi:polyhydroxyalkanoate synthase